MGVDAVIMEVDASLCDDIELVIKAYLAGVAELTGARKACEAALVRFRKDGVSANLHAAVTNLELAVFDAGPCYVDKVPHIRNAQRLLTDARAADYQNNFRLSKGI